MHIPTLATTLFLLCATTSALPLSTRSSSLASKCTFTLLQKQVREVNYIQINQITDHANDITIDVAHLRPKEEHNSYAMVSATRVFAVEGLLDYGNLTVRGKDGRDELGFESAGVSWSSEGRGREAWCDVGAWGESGPNKERRMECAFPCASAEVDEERIELR